MTTDAQLVEELRSLFRKGATTSRLIRHLAGNFSGERQWSIFVSDYFWAAFQVPVRVPERTRPPATEEADFEFLNRDVLHEIIVHRPVWDSDAGSERTWYHSLVATNDLAQYEKIRPEQSPELSAGWTTLDSRSREYLQSRLASAVGYSERMLILSALAERLQQQIVELEDQLNRVQKRPRTPLETTPV